MHFAEVLKSKLKQRANKNFNEIALIFQLLSNPSPERNDSLY